MDSSAWRFHPKALALVTPAPADEGSSDSIATVARALADAKVKGKGPFSKAGRGDLSRFKALMSVRILGTRTYPDETAAEMGNACLQTKP